MLEEILRQTEQSARLAEQAQKTVDNVRGLRSGDKVFTPIIASAEFAQGAAPSANLVFNVPSDADFWAYRLLFYPYCKVVDPVNLTPDEVTFRPTSFAFQPYSPGSYPDPATQYTDYANLVDGTFGFLYEGEELQNLDTPVAACYGASMGKWSSVAYTYQVPAVPAQNQVAPVWGGASQTPAGFVFDIPFFLPRSKALTVRFTPTYLGVRTITDTITGPTTITRQHRYKIVGVLEGEKKVAAFR